MFTGQFPDKPTLGQSSRGLVNSLTANFFNHGITTLYLYTKSSPNPIDYW